MPRQKVVAEYLFDRRLGFTGRYVNKTTGKIVPYSVVEKAAEAQITKSRADITTIARRLADGEISVAEWQTLTRNKLKIIHTQGAAVAKGGWGRMSPSDWGAVGRISRDQYKYLERFAGQIASGKQKLRNLAGEISGQFLRRVDLYAQAGNATRNKMEEREAVRSGATEERRVLDPVVTNHCDCCVAEAKKGWQPIGSGNLKPIGECTCSQNCRCRKEYR